MELPEPDPASIFWSISTLTSTELRRAGRRQSLQGNSGTVTEIRPWGRLEWAVGKKAESNPKLLAIHVVSPRLQFSTLEVVRWIIRQPLSAKWRRTQAPTHSWHAEKAASKNPATATVVLRKGDCWFFDSILPLFASMRSIEVAQAETDMMFGLGSPAWFLIWGLSQSYAAVQPTAQLILDAGAAAGEYRRSAPPRARREDCIDANWYTYTWLRSDDPFDEAAAELVRVTALVKARAQRLARAGRDVGGVLRPARSVRRVPLKPAAVREEAPVDLETVRAVHQEVRDAFTAFCFDPHAVLARPLLNDVSDARTAAFYGAQEAAESAETMLQLRPGADTAQAYRRAVEDLAGAWDAADIHARECGVSHLSTIEQNDVRKARRALDLALDPNTPAGEREAAYRAVLALLAGLVKVPAPALARMIGQIDSVRRQQLTDDR